MGISPLNTTVDVAMNEEQLRFISIEERSDYGFSMFWWGTFVGAIGTGLLGFVSLYTLGAFLP